MNIYGVRTRRSKQVKLSKPQKEALDGKLIMCQETDINEFVYEAANKFCSLLACASASVSSLSLPLPFFR